MDSSEKNNYTKCGKLESLFVFQNEEKLKEHLAVCEECKEEYLQQMKVSAAIKETAPFYLERRKKIRRMYTSAACCFAAALVFIFTPLKMYDNNDNVYQALVYTEQESAISMMGLPVDEYGFLSI